jgi:hypothetical protein
MADWARTL